MQVVAFKHILCPVDFSEYSQFAVDVLPELVDAAGGQVTLMHVIEIPVSYAGELPVEFTRELDKHATTVLDRWAAKLTAKLATPAKTKIMVGSAGNQILRLLDEDPTFDLVVMGSHGRTGVKRMLLGSVAEKVVRHAPCAVLVARSR